MNKVKKLINFLHISFLIDHLHFPDLTLILHVFLYELLPLYWAKWYLFNVRERTKNLSMIFFIICKLWTL